MQAAHISNLQRGVVPNVLDSLYLGPSPEQRVKEASINSFKATFVTGEMHSESRRKVAIETVQVGTLSSDFSHQTLSLHTVDLIHQTSHCN